MKKLLLIFILYLPTVVTSQELKKEEFKVAWGKFEGVNLSLSNSTLTSTLPSYLYDNFPRDLKHYPTDIESALIYKQIRDDKIEDKKREKLKLLEQRDALLFNKDVKKTQRDDISKKLVEKNRELENLHKIDLEKLKPIDFIDIEFLPEESGKLDYISRKRLMHYLKTEDIDYYIHGLIEEINTELFLKVYLYSRYSSDPVIIWSGVGSSEEILGYRDEVLDSVILEVSSKELITFQIETEPKDALIYIDEDFKGLGSFKGFGLDGDILDIEISKEGFSSLSLSTSLTLENSSFNLELIKNSIGFVTIKSSPSGAMAYYGSKYIGVTPIEVPRLSYPLKLTLSLDGYLDKHLVIDQYTEDQMVNFNREYIDTQEYFEKEKEKFYISTGIFSISLALPLYLTAQYDILSGDALNNIRYISIGNAIFWGINLFYRLYRYLEAAKLSVE